MQTTHLATPPVPARCVVDTALATAIETLPAPPAGTVQPPEGIAELAGTGNLLSQRAEAAALARDPYVGRTTLPRAGARGQGAAFRPRKHAF